MLYGGKDELFSLDSDSELPFRKRKKQKTIKCRNYAASEAQDLDLDSPQLTSKHAKKKKKSSKGKISHVRKPLFQLLAEENLSIASAYPNFLTMTVKTALYPRRFYCSVCGYERKYTCLRCGEKYCSRKCGVVHRETHCLKFEIS